MIPKTCKLKIISYHFIFRIFSWGFVVLLRMDFNKWNPFWAACCGFIAFLIIVGNTLTIATLLKKKFRTGPHFLLISLAVADLLVGCTIPMYIAGMFMFSYALELLYVALYLAMFSTISSIVHLPVISLERLHAILRPFRHRRLSLTAYWVAIAIPWIFSLSIALPGYLIRWSHQRSNLVFFVLAFLTTPLLVTCFCYILIWKKRRESRGKVRSFQQNQEARFSRTIFLVTAASFAMWMPFQLCTIIIGVWGIKVVPMSVFFPMRILQFSNSFVNFAIYFFRFPRYRKALFSMFSCKAPKRQFVTTPLPSSSSGTYRPSQVFVF